MKKFYLFSLMMILLVVACAGPTAVEPAASDAVALEDVSSTSNVAETLYANEEANFSIALPSEWLVAEATVDGLSQMRSENGALSFLTDDFAQALIANGLQLFALNSDSNTVNNGIPASIKVIHRDAPTSLTLEELVADTTNQLKNIVELTTAIEQTSVMLGNDEAVQISYSMMVDTTVGAEAEVHNTQYYVMKDGDLYILTVEMGQELVDAYLESSRTVAETFQITVVE